MREQNIQDYLQKNGYRPVKGNSMYEIMCKTAHGKKSVIVLIDNLQDVVYTYQNIESVRSQVADMLCIQPENILTVVLDTKISRSKYYSGKNVVSVNFYTGQFKKYRVSMGLWDEYRAVLEAVRFHKSCRNVQDKGLYFYEHERYLTLAVWLVIALNILVAFRSLGNYEQWGISGNKAYFDNEAYRFITYMFVHGNIPHLIGNMVSLLYIGNFYIRREGYSRFLMVYLLGGFYAGLISVFTQIFISGSAEAVTVGASGAVFAVFGAVIAKALFQRDRSVPTTKIILMASLSLLSGYFSPGVNNSCHIGGFVGGFLLQTLLVLKEYISFENISVKEIPQLKKYGRTISYIERR